MFVYGVDHEIRDKVWPYYACVKVAKASWRECFEQHSSAVSTLAWKILYSLILVAAECLAPHRRQTKRLPKAKPPYVMYLLSFLF